MKTDYDLHIESMKEASFYGNSIDSSLDRTSLESGYEDGYYDGYKKGYYDNNFLDLFKELPHLNGDYEVIDDWGYTPSIYHFDTQWLVSWVHCEDGDTLLDYAADTPEEAINLAYNNYKKDIGILNKQKEKEE